MAWFRVDDMWHNHPKVVGLTLAARGLWVTAGSWCSHHLTDGRIPQGLPRAFGATARQADELVRAGLWLKDGDGFVFHDWAEMNPLRANVLRRRGKETTRKRVQRERVPQGHRAGQDADGARDNWQDRCLVPPPVHAESMGPPDPDPGSRKRSEEDPPLRGASSSARTGSPVPLAQIERRVRRLYSEAYSAQLVAVPPQTPRMAEGYARIAEWVQQTAQLRGIDPLDLAEQLVGRFFASAKAAQAGFKLSWLATNPVEFWEPPSAVAAAPARTRAGVEYDRAVFAAEQAAKSHPGLDWESPQLKPYAEAMRVAADALRNERGAT